MTLWSFSRLLDVNLSNDAIRFMTLVARPDTFTELVCLSESIVSLPLILVIRTGDLCVEAFCIFECDILKLDWSWLYRG